MLDSRILLDIGQERQRDLLADAVARRQIRQLNRRSWPTHRIPPGLLLRLLATIGL